MSLVVDSVAPSLPVQGSAEARFPVRRIYCVGRNYVEHAVEMGHSGREAPFFFMKPGDAVLPVAEGTLGRMHYPGLTSNLHYELELVVAIGKGGHDIPAAQALEQIWGYAVGLDMTRRDLQAEAKALGRPWCMAKGFDESAPVGPLRRAAECRLSDASRITLEVNRATRQSSTLGKMIWSVPEIIEHVSQGWTLAPGDLIFTGTPAGVAAVNLGDTLRGRIDGVGSIELEIVGR